jgi:hypothetical protein
MHGKRGIVLVTVLFFILLIGILSRAILSAGPLVARVGGQLSEALVAQRAAEAGAGYACAQMKAKNDWKGDKNAVTVSLPDMKIEEDHGNVVGWMKNASGTVSMFRIRFNFQDGNPATEGLDDPTTYWIDSPYLSLNCIPNLVNNGVVPRGDTAGSPWAVSAPATGSLTLTTKRATVAVEGITGRALEATTGPGPIPAGSVVKCVLRVGFGASGSPTAPDSVISAGNGIETQVNVTTKVAIVGGGTARLRTKKGINVGNNSGATSILDMNGEAGRDTSLPSAGLNATLSGSVTSKTETVGDGQDFYNIKWADVPKASTDENTAVQLPGGIYVVALDGKVRWYDTDPANFKSLDQTVGCVTISSTNFSEVRTGANLAALPTGIKLDSSTFTVNVTKDLNIKASPNGHSDVMFTVPSGRPLSQNDTAKPYVSSTTPMSFYAPGVLHIEDATVSCPGNMTVLTNVKAKNGTLTSGGNSTVCAPSVDIDMTSATAFTQRLSMYVKGDLTLSTWQENPALPPYVPAINEYGPLKVKGLVYSWGDMNILAGTRNQAAPPGVYKASSYGNVSITGALVAYGADPNTGKPGLNNNGAVKIYGETADIVYDATLLVPGTTLTAGSPLQGLRRVSYGFEK